MKPFNINEHLEHPDWEVVTREGRPVQIVYTELNDSDYPVVAIIGNWCPYKFTADGLFLAGKVTKYDLFFATKKHEGWVNLYRDLGLGVIRCRCVFDSEEDAEKEGMTDKTYIGTTKIQWEE